MSDPGDGNRIEPREAYERVGAGRLVLIDIRERHEQLTGMAEGARPVGERSIEEAVEQALSGEDGPEAIALICARGVRSALACAEIQGRVGVGLFNVRGGMERWTEAGLPVALPQSDLSDSERRRYLRHLALPGVGEAGQLRLKRARVLVIGAGGLGSPCAMYLAAAGIGRLGIVDDDGVELSNLQRQLLHGERQLGMAKAESACSRLAGLNSDITIEPHRDRVGPGNVDELLDGYDIVVDGSDNFPTRYLLNDACIRLGKTLVYGAVERFSGQVGVFRAGDGDQPCYRCLFPEPPAPEDAPSCAEAGVLGVLPGVIGTLQAVEVLKISLGIGAPLIGRVVSYDALAATFRTTRVARDPDCVWCDPDTPIDAYPDYQRFCGT